MICIRQVALVATDLTPALEAVRSVLDLGIAFNDPSVGVFGLHNGVIPIGDTFLEIVSPVDPNCSAARYLARRSGDGGYMVIVQTPDLAPHRERLDRESFPVVFEHIMDDIGTLHLHPQHTGGALLSIDASHPPKSWRWAGPDWRDRIRNTRCEKILGVEIQCHDPGDVADRWSRALGCPSRTIDTEREITVGTSVVRFTGLQDERGDGLRTVLLHCSDAAAIEAAAESRGFWRSPGLIELAGTYFRLL